MSIGFVRSDADVGSYTRSLGYLATAQWIEELVLRARICQLEDALAGSDSGRTAIVIEKALEGLPWLLEAIGERQTIEFDPEQIRARLESLHEDVKGMAEAHASSRRPSEGGRNAVPSSSRLDLSAHAEQVKVLIENMDRNMGHIRLLEQLLDLFDEHGGMEIVSGKELSGLLYQAADAYTGHGKLFHRLASRLSSMDAASE